MFSYAFRYGFVSFATVLALALLAPTVTAAPDAVERGKYLVGPAGQCADCHGATLAGAPQEPGPPGVPWAERSANLRGLPMFATDAAAIAYLETARLPNGRHARGPMPRYHFNVVDATAIVAYLRSLSASRGVSR
jgi:mono/diheme cytochrome c family protein